MVMCGLRLLLLLLLLGSDLMMQLSLVLRLLLLLLQGVFAAPAYVTDPTPTTQGTSGTSISAIGGRKFVQGLTFAAYCPAYYSASQVRTPCIANDMQYYE
jgi:hypothetical protein